MPFKTGQIMIVTSNTIRSPFLFVHLVVITQLQQPNKI